MNANIGVGYELPEKPGYQILPGLSYPDADHAIDWLVASGADRAFRWFCKYRWEREVGVPLTNAQYRVLFGFKKLDGEGK